MEQLTELTSNKEMFFTFMSGNFKVFQNSNIFLRDVQYAVKSYFEKRNVKLKRVAAEKLAVEFLRILESGGDLKKITSNAWKVNFSFNKNVTEVKTEAAQ